jgi:hypothetical protein
VAGGRAASVSAYISQALARRDADEEMAETIAVRNSARRFRGNAS